MKKPPSMRFAPSPLRRPLVLVALCLATGAVQAANYGMVVGGEGRTITVFDADTDTVLGTLTPPGAGILSDCAISDDQRVGFVSDYDGRVWVVDPAAVALAGGTNPIAMPTKTADLSLSADQQFLLATSDLDPVTASPYVDVIDVESRTLLGSVNAGGDFISIEACTDNSLLLGQWVGGYTRRLVIDGAGAVVDSGESLPSSIANPSCAPQGGAAVASNYSPSQLRSFLYPPLTDSGLDNRAMTGNALASAINPAGTQAFVRSFGRVRGFTYDPETGALGAAPFADWLVTSPAFGWFGPEYLAFHPNGRKLYVSEVTSLKAYDPATGALLSTISTPAMTDNIGVCLPKPITTSANLRLAFNGASTPVRGGTTVPVYARLDNYGRDGAKFPIVDFSLSDPSVVVAVSAPSGWQCRLKSPGNHRCTASAMPRGTVQFKLSVTTPASAGPSGFITIGGRAFANSIDPVADNNSASYKLYVKASGAITPVSSAVR